MLLSPAAREMAGQQHRPTVGAGAPPQPVGAQPRPAGAVAAPGTGVPASSSSGVPTGAVGVRPGSGQHAVSGPPTFAPRQQVGPAQQLRPVFLVGNRQPAAIGGSAVAGQVVQGQKKKKFAAGRA